MDPGIKKKSLSFSLLMKRMKNKKENQMYWKSIIHISINDSQSSENDLTSEREFSAISISSQDSDLVVVPKSLREKFVHIPDYLPFLLIKQFPRLFIIPWNEGILAITPMLFITTFSSLSFSGFCSHLFGGFDDFSVVNSLLERLVSLWLPLSGESLGFISLNSEWL